MDASAQTPELRFQGFTGPWKETMLCDCCEMARGSMITQKAARSGDVPVIAGGIAPTYTCDQANREGETITVAGSGAYAGYVAFWNRPIFVSDAFSIKGKKGVSTRYIFGALKKLQDQIYRAQTGATIPHVQIPCIEHFSILLPSLSEQEEIGFFFAELDKDLTHQEARLERLKRLKASCLAKLFPQEDSSVPELRFQGFNEPWKKVTLGSLCRIRTGKLDANAAVPNGEYAFFTCNKETLRTTTYAFEGDAILVNGNGDLGYTRIYSGRFDAYQRTYVLMQFKGDFHYIECAIARYLAKRVEAEAMGGAMPYIKVETLDQLSLPLPSLPEQEKIGEFFMKLDAVLALQEQKVEWLRRVKTTLLEKLFV